MSTPDLFVGSVAVLAGACCFLSAVVNNDWLFRFWLGRVIDKRWGRLRARQFYVVCGIGMIALGIAIANGWRWQLIPEQDTAQNRVPRSNSIVSLQQC